jgi:glutamate transport system permease protein
MGGVAMSSILFDAPGPRARRRHRIYTVIFILVALGIIAWVAVTLADAEVLTREVFELTFQENNVEYMIDGLQNTLKAAVFAIVTSLAFGAVFAVGRLSNHRPIQWPAVAVVEVFRAIPLVLLIIIIWFAYKSVIGTLGALVAGLTLYNGSVLAEVFRAGINAVPKGQVEAAYALGMRKTQVMMLIQFPQAVKFMLPAIISQCVVILKDTSLGFVILYEELVNNARQVALFVPNGTVVVYATAAIAFIVINYSLSKLAEYLERRLSRRGQGKEVEEVEALTSTAAG